MQDPLIIEIPAASTRRVEVARSFSFKLNAGNYESRDFFCSQKVECFEHEAAEMSEKVYQFCRREVMRAVAETQRELGITPRPQALKSA